MANRLKVVKFPLEVLTDLQKRFPNMSNPTRFRLVHRDFLEMQEIRSKVNVAGQIVYGKLLWKKRK